MSPEAATPDPALGRRALITGAAVLGAAGVASIAGAQDADASNGDALRVGRRDNIATGATALTMDRGRLVDALPPAFKVTDNRAGNVAIQGQASDGGRGVVGIGATGVSGVGRRFGGTFSGATGVEGSSVEPAGIGVQGEATNGGLGISGVSSSGTGVKGASTSGTGVEGTTTSGAQAVLGAHPATTGNATGVKGTSASATGVGVTGVASHASGITQGVRGDGTASPLGTGVVGLGQANGVYGESRKAGGKGVFGVATQAQGAASHGVYGQTASTTGAGVYGQSPSYAPDLGWNVTSYGVYAEGAIASSGPAFLGVPEYGTTARSDSRLQDGTMTFSADFTTGSPKLIVLVKNTDGRLFKAELPLTAI